MAEYNYPEHTAITIIENSAKTSDVSGMDGNQYFYCLDGNQVRLVLRQQANWLYIQMGDHGAEAQKI